MTTYHVWCPEHHETRDDACAYDAFDAAMAVEAHAAYEYSECDGWEWMPRGEPTYRCEGNGETVDIVITVDFEPRFYAGVPSPVVEADPSAEAPEGSEGG